MSETDSPNPQRPIEPLFRYVVGLTRTVTQELAAYYDVVVEVEAGTAEERITNRAAETVAGHIEPVNVEDLTLAQHDLEAVVLDPAAREQVPPTLATIEFVEQIRYEYDDLQCEGSLFDVEATPEASHRLEALVLARQIGDTDPDGQTVHAIPPGNIEADLAAGDSTN